MLILFLIVCWAMRLIYIFVRANLYDKLVGMRHEIANERLVDHRLLVHDLQSLVLLDHLLQVEILLETLYAATVKPAQLVARKLMKVFATAPEPAAAPFPQALFAEASHAIVEAAAEAAEVEKREALDVFNASEHRAKQLANGPIVQSDSLVVVNVVLIQKFKNGFKVVWVLVLLRLGFVNFSSMICAALE